MADWKISRRRGVCAICERAFEDGEQHVSTLRVTPEGLERRDHCLAWWEANPKTARGDACRAACLERSRTGGSGPGEGEELFWWRTRHQCEKRRTVQLDLESLERLFIELEESRDLRLEELRYVLCLILMRKRRVKVERVLRTPDGEAFQVKRPRRDERYHVRIFDFSPERMGEIRAELQAIFDGAEALEGVDGRVVDGDGLEERSAPEGASAEEGALPPQATPDPTSAEETAEA